MGFEFVTSVLFSEYFCYGHSCQAQRPCLIEVGGIRGADTGNLYECVYIYMLYII